MDQHSQARGRSPSGASPGSGHPSHIRQSHSPSSPGRFPNDAAPSSNIGLGLGIDPASQHFQSGPADFSTFNSANATSYLNNQQQQQHPSFSQPSLADPAFDLPQGFTHQLNDDDPAFGAQQQPTFGQTLLDPNFGGDADFTIFPPSTGEQQNYTPLFVQDHQPLGSPDENMMAQSTTPPHMLHPDPHQSSSANHSPSFNQHQFSSPPARHSRNTSLVPEAALLPGQVDWSRGPQFQNHRRTPSEYSDVSSVAPSPNLVTADSFEIDPRHSPMQQPQDMGLYSELQGITNFTISDPMGTHSPSQHGRSPSHSPAISPRLLPQSIPDGNQLQQSFGMQPPNGYGQQSPYLPSEAFPQLQHPLDSQGQMPAPPSINIDFAPPAMKSGFDQLKSVDVDSLTPPERGRPRSRPRAVTDPYNSTSPHVTQRTPSASSSLSPNAAGDSRDSSRSLSPLDRSGASPNRRRQSTSAVPNNVIALRLADPEYNGPGAQVEGGPGGTKRAQKHPATFQCTLCPKRFTRAYNLRSHLRTHTDERPFVCTVCGKAFARQHDRKRHEGLHSGEKKFVCKGELKAGGQWGCGRRFARADALGRHFRSEAGRICIKPLLDEEMLERQRIWNEQHMQQAAAQGMVMQPPNMMMPGMDPATGYPMDNGGGYAFPAALLAQYPALAQMNWSADMGGGGSGLDDEMSGRSSFEASDFEENDDGGYVSGPGTGFGPGGMQENFGEIGYASDYGGR